MTHSGARVGASAVVVGGFLDQYANDIETLRLLVPSGSTAFEWKAVAGLTLASPTYGAYDAGRAILYTSHSGQEHLSAIAIDVPGRSLRLLGTAPTGSVNPVHLALAPNRRFILAAGFTSGHVSVIELASDGALGGLVSANQLAAAAGPLPPQTGCQPHQIVFSADGRHVFVPDRGSDRVHVFRFDPESGALVAREPALVQAGAGPRHLVLHPTLTELAYLVNELDSTVAVLHWDVAAERLSSGEAMPTVPTGFRGQNSAAALDISADGRFVYVSNRGHDSVVGYATSASGQRLHRAGWTPVSRTPRFLGLDPTGAELWVAAQGSHLIQRFDVSPVSGALTHVGSLAFPSPACITFVPPSGGA